MGPRPQREGLRPIAKKVLGLAQERIQAQAIESKGPRFIKPRRKELPHKGVVSPSSREIGHSFASNKGF